MLSLSMRRKANARHPKKVKQLLFSPTLLHFGKKFSFFVNVACKQVRILEVFHSKPKLALKAKHFGNVITVLNLLVHNNRIFSVLKEISLELFKVIGEFLEVVEIAESKVLRAFNSPFKGFHLAVGIRRVESSHRTSGRLRLNTKRRSGPNQSKESNN